MARRRYPYRESPLGTLSPYQRKNQSRVSKDTDIEAFTLADAQALLAPKEKPKKATATKKTTTKKAPAKTATKTAAKKTAKK